MVPEAKKSPQTVTAQGELLRPDLIEGLVFKDVRSVVAGSGVVTELWRPEWLGEESRPGHVVHVTLTPFNETNWHCHKRQTDLLAVVRGHIKIAFYDDREDSRTYRRLNVMAFSHVRPTLVQIPPGVWHVLKNIGAEEAAFITMNTHAFNYKDPDDWRLPKGNTSLPQPF